MTRKNKVGSILEFGSTPAVFVVLIILVGCAWGFYRPWRFGEEKDEARRGQVGDSYGGLNTLFTGLAFAGLCYSIILQKKSIFDERQEDEARKDAEYQRQLEAEFFQLLSILNQTVIGLRLTLSNSSYAGNSTYYEGRQVLNFLWHNSRIGVKVNSMKENLPAGCLSLYEVHYSEYSHIIGPYFRVLYRLLKFIDKSDLREERKVAFAKILRAQMSGVEVGYILLNCLVGSNGKMTQLVFKYDMLKHLPVEVISLQNQSSLLVAARANVPPPEPLDQVSEGGRQGIRSPSTDAVPETK